MQMQMPTDPFILELLPEFLGTWIEDVNIQLPELIHKRDAQGVYRLGHTIKGSCAQFGLDEISTTGIELMGYAKNEDWKSIEPMRQRLSDAFIAAKQFVDEHIGA